MKISSREIKAIFFSIVLLIAGIAISYWQCDAAWVSRFGALIIIVGVYFAFSDLPERFEKNARAMIKLRTEFTIQDVITQLEDEDRSKPLTQEQLNFIRRYLTPSETLIEKEANKRKNRFYFIEALIICVGTFTNGFGQWILENLW